MTYFTAAALRFKNYRITAWTVVCAIVYLGLDVGYEWDVFETVHDSINDVFIEFEDYELDEIVLALFFVGIALFIDLLLLRLRARQRYEIDRYRIQTMHATIATAQDVVNNFLNSLQLFRFEAERSGALSEESLKTFDTLVEETAQKIKDIQDMDTIVERQIGGDITILEVDKK